MKHKSVDLYSEINRASLPPRLEGFLFPMFEAVSNALHSIEDQFGDKATENGYIEIIFDDQEETISVLDNGEGFNNRNLDAFLTPFTGNKLKRNGKGFGRFISFKIFENVYYASPTDMGDGGHKSATFEYKPLDLADNLIEFDDEEVMGKHPFDHGLTVSFKNPKERYRDYFTFGEPDKDSAYSEETVVQAVLDHFLLEFIQEKTPNSFKCEIGGVSFNLADYYSESIREGFQSSVNLKIDGVMETFNFEFTKIDAKKAKRHNLYFYSDNRATSDLENISKGMKESAFEGANKERYFYLVAVSSSFFVSSQSRDRIENLNVKIKQDKREKPLKEILAATAKSKILEAETEYTAGRRATMRKHVESLIALDPMLRRGLGDKDIDEFVSERGILEDREQIARDLFIARMRSKFDFSKINSKTSIEELERVVQDNIPADAKEALAVYVAYRNDVIKILKEMLHRTDGKLAKEDAVHQLVYPRYKDSDEIDYASHNLWLIDDDLAFAEYISSDRTTKGNKREAGAFAHDLLLNNQDELLLVEMKRPQKESYDSEATGGGMTNNPVQQLKTQIGQIRDRGTVKTSTGREIKIPKDKMVRGYVLADWNESLESYLKDEEFIISDQGGPMAYRYFSPRNLLIEVLAFDRLADRASKRNAVFVQILEGGSDRSGTKRSKLAAE